MRAWNFLRRGYIADMKRFVLVPVLALFFAAGCGQSSSSSSGTNATATTNSGSGDPLSQYVGALGRAKQNAGKTVDVASINQAVNMFQVDKGRFPNSLDELVQTGYLKKLPDVPYGMKLDYDATTGQVKVVQQ